MSVYREGHREGLCGPYAVINAVALLWPTMPSTMPEEVMKLSTSVLKELHLLPDALKKGFGRKPLSKVLDATSSLCETRGRFRVHRRMLSRSYISNEELWYRLEDHFQNVARRTAIAYVRNEAKGVDHWTCISSVTERRISVADAAGFKYFNRGQVDTLQEAKGRYAMWPTHCFLLTRQEAALSGARKTLHRRRPEQP